MQKCTRIIFSLIITAALLSGIGLPFDVPPATAAEEKEQPPPQKYVIERQNLKLSSYLDRLVMAEEQGKAEEFAWQ